MITTFALILPIIATLIGFFISDRKQWWIFPVSFLACLLVVVSLKNLSEYSLTTDTEYWGGYVTHANYDEDWNKRVHCRHEITKRVSYECGTKKRRSTCYKTVGTGRYEHPYDVDYYPEKWYFEDSMGNETGIDKSEFERLAVQFGNRDFVDLHRDYHTNDGDRYTATWKGEKDKIEVVTVAHSYTNRVQASTSVFKFGQVDDRDKKQYGLYEYPAIAPYNQQTLLGYSDPKAQKELDFVNGTYGSKLQVRVYVLVFQNQPLKAASKQQALWMGGNKNEIVVCIGVDSEAKVTWSKVFSWSDGEAIKVSTRNKVMEQSGNKLEVMPIVTHLEEALPKEFKRKQFKDFDYLSVQQPTWSVVLTFILCIAICAGTVIYSVMKPRY